MHRETVHDQQLGPRARPDRNRQPERIKSMGPIALQVRPVCVVFRLVHDPLPVPAGLPSSNLHRHFGVFLDVPYRELLGLDLFRFLLSQTVA